MLRLWANNDDLLNARCLTREIRYFCKLLESSYWGFKTNSSGHFKDNIFIVRDTYTAQIQIKCHIFLYTYRKNLFNRRLVKIEVIKVISLLVKVINSEGLNFAKRCSTRITYYVPITPIFMVGYLIWEHSCNEERLRTSRGFCVLQDSSLVLGPLHCGILSSCVTEQRTCTRCRCTARYRAMRAISGTLLALLRALESSVRSHQL